MVNQEYIPADTEGKEVIGNRGAKKKIELEKFKINKYLQRSENMNMLTMWSTVVIHINGIRFT